MSSFPKVATDFDQIIQADRQRRKNEELAKEIFSRNRQKDSKKKDDKRPGRTPTPSLASRIGIAKRSSSTSSNNNSSRNQQKPRNSLPAQNVRVNRLANEITNEATTNLLPSQPTSTLSSTSNIGSGISIKGASGPFVLHASNFAPGTTAADIESALHPDTLYNNGISSLVSCKIVDTRPNVVAELVFTEKIVAESIIAKYNGQKADGRILQVELVRSGVGSMSKTHNQAQQPQRMGRRDRQPGKQQQPMQAPQPLQLQQSLPQDADVDFEPELDVTDDNAMIDVEMDTEAATAGATSVSTNTFNEDREAADRDRRDRDSRHNRGGHYDNPRRGDEERRRNDRDRDRDRDQEQRERDRDRDRDRERDRDYERREERPRDDRRGTMASHYGNGVGNNQRGGYVGGSGGGGGGGGGAGGGGYGGYRGGRYGEGYGAAGGRGMYRGGYRGYG